MLPFEGCNVGAILSCCKEAVKLFQLGPLCRICNENDEARRLGVPHLWPSRVKAGEMPELARQNRCMPSARI